MLIDAIVVFVTAVVFTMIGHAITAKSNNVPLVFPSRRSPPPPAQPPEGEEIDTDIPEWQRD